MGHQELAGGADGLFLGDRRATDLDALAIDGDARLGRSFDLLYELIQVGLTDAGSSGCRDERVVEVVEVGVGEEVVDDHELSVRGALLGAGSQVSLHDDDAGIGRNFVDGGMLDDEVGTVELDAVAEAGGAHGGGAHARVAGEDDLVAKASLSVGGGVTSLHAGDGCLSTGEVGDVRGADDRRSDEEGHGSTGKHAEQDHDGLALRRHSEERDDGAGGGGADKAKAEDGEQQDGDDVAHDRSNDDLGVHEHVGEVDLMDAAQEVDDDGAGGRLLGRLVLAEEAVGQKDAEAGAGVGLEHVHDGLASGLGLLGGDGHEDAVADGVVEEQDLSRFDEDGKQRQQVSVDEKLDARLQNDQDSSHEGTNAVVACDHQEHAQDTEREVVNEHLEAGGLPVVGKLVPLLDDEAGERTHEHGAHKHGVFGADDGTHDGDRADDATALAGNVLTALSGDHDGNQKLEGGTNQLAELCVGHPTRINKECSEEAPCDEGSDVGHDHAAEGFTKTRDLGANVCHVPLLTSEWHLP